jgi:DNA-binding CsgD family transcriptional regulator
LAVVLLGYPLCTLYEYLYIYKQSAAPSFITSIITIINITLFLIACVLLGNNRLRALISATFSFSIIHLAQIPVGNFYIVFVYPVADMPSFLEALLQFPKLYYSVGFFITIIIAVCCLLAARWLRVSKLKPPHKLYISFNLLFVLFPLTVLLWFSDLLMGLSISFLSSALIGTLFIGTLLFLLYLYTRLTKEKLTAAIQETVNPLPLAAVKADEYKQFIQHLSRRELDVVEAVLAGNYSYKELSKTLDISLNTVRTHIKHIYKTTSVSNMTALTTLFHGFTPMHPKFTPKSPPENS